MTRNTVLRLLVFAIGIPLLVVSAFVGRDSGLPLFGALAIVVSAVAAREISYFFPRATHLYRGARIIIPLIGGIVPLAGYLPLVVPAVGAAMTRLPASAVIMVTVLIAAVVMASQVGRTRSDEFSTIVATVALHIFLLIYPGLFAWHAVRLVTLPHASETVLLFLLAVYLNDSTAWLTGRLFGQLTRGSHPPVAISPNKSLAGFVGGFVASILTVEVMFRLFPHLLPAGIVSRLAFGAAIGLAAIFGDLVESALKRSASLKDSGQMIPGRGGLLDSIDSALYAAPFFYYGYALLFIN